MPPYGAQADAVRRFYERTGPDEPVRWRRICRHLVACSRNARYLMAFRRRGVVLKVQRTDTFIETRQDSRRGPEDRHVDSSRVSHWTSSSPAGAKGSTRDRETSPPGCFPKAVPETFLSTD